MYRTFEYCRYTAGPRVLQESAAQVKTAFAQRAADSGGKLFGCWRSLVGLGLARDEGIAMTAWPSEAAARAAPAPDGAVTGNERHIVEATVRPTSDVPPIHEGVYVFRWFDMRATDWREFCDLSDAAWPNMETVFDVNICGFWRSQDIAEPDSRTLLLTRYADLSVWEASHWWNNPVADADESMSRFRTRNQLVFATVAYPSLPIL